MLLENIRSFTSQSGFKKYFFNTGWMFVDKILRLIAGLFIGAYVARYLGPSNYGLLNYVISLVSLFSVVTSLGLDTLVVRELINEEGKKDLILGSSFYLRLTAATIVFGILFLFVQITQPDKLTRSLIYIIGSGTFFEVFGLIDYFFQAKVSSKFAVWSQMISLVVISMVRIWLVLIRAPLEWFAATYTLDFLLLAIGLVFFYTKNKNTLFNWKF